jgi:hypothetical protein
MNMTPILFAFVILQKSNLLISQGSEARYRGLLDNLDAGVVVHAADTSVL